MKSKWLRVLTIGLAASLMVFGCHPGPTICTCTGWGPVGVNWTYASKSQSVNTQCGDSMNMQADSGSTIYLTSTMGCTPAACQPDYKWVYSMDGGSTNGTFAGLPAVITPQPGFHTYYVTLMAWCDGIQCPNCSVTLNVTTPVVSNCTCKGWNAAVVAAWVDKNQVSHGPYNVHCGETVPELIDVNPGTSITITASPMCEPQADYCQPLCSYYVYKEGNLWKDGVDCQAKFYPDAGCHAYRVDFTGGCGDGVPSPCPRNCSIYLCACNGTVTRCNCTNVWSPVSVSWTDPQNVQKQSSARCGGSLEIAVNPSNPTIAVNASIGCTPADKCKASYTWNITTVSGNPPSPTSGSGLPAVFTPGSGTSAYVVTLLATCDGTMCRNCTIYLNVTNGTVTRCDCTNVWSPVSVSWTDPQNVQQDSSARCGGSLGIAVNPSNPTIAVNASMGCTPADTCKASYTWNITTVSGNPPSPTSGSGLPAVFTPGSGTSAYAVTLLATCDGTMCLNCTIYLNVTNGTVTKCDCTNRWSAVTVSWTDPQNVQQNSSTKCGDSLRLAVNPSNPTIAVNSSMGCTPADKCKASYTWNITTVSGNPPSPTSGSGLPAVFTPGSGTSAYTVTLLATCDGTICLNCTIYLNVTRPLLVT